MVDKNGKLYECECALFKRISSSMPAFIRTANIKSGHLNLDLINKIDKSFYIVSSWEDIMAILKAIMIKYNNKFIKLTSDREIRDVYVGSRSAKAREMIDEAGTGIYNSLFDLMDPPDLMIVRLNELSYKNKAAPGALEEALTYRLDRLKPTWVISDKSKLFNPGSFSFSESVWLLLKSIPEINVPVISEAVQTYQAPAQTTQASDLNNPTESIKHNHLEALSTEKLEPYVSPSNKPKLKIKSIPDEEPEGVNIFGSGLKKK